MESRIRVRTIKAISDILKTVGYEVHQASPPLDLSGVLEGQYLVVLCSDDPNTAAKYDETEYTIKSEKGDINCNKLLVTYNSGVAADSCIVWHMEEIIKYAGEAASATILGEKLHINLQKGQDVLSQVKISIDTAEKVIEVPHIPVRIGREDAEERAGLAGLVSLRLLPYWSFKYKIEGNAEFKGEVVIFDGTGTGAMNAINGSLSDIETDAIITTQIPKGADIVFAAIKKDEAINKIKDYLIRINTRQVKLKQIIGDAIFYEEKNLAPERKNISIGLQEVYIPVWQVKGRRIIEINAYTGERLQEPMDDGVEVL